MNEPQLPLYEPDEDTLARDDALLDALGSGLETPGDDTLAMAMYLWREDLSAPPKAIAAERARRRKRRITWSIAVGLAAALGAGAAATAAYYAEPGGPLFPVTEVVFPEHASTASAEGAKERLADAQTAVEQKHLPEAEKLLKEAEALIAKVTSLVEREVLMAELQRVRAVLTSVLTGTPLPGLAPSAAPSPGGIPGLPGGGQPTPTPSPARSGLLPLPLPTISLPPLLPSFPRL
jgi:hypothetical protein